MIQYLVIAARNHPDIYGYLRRQFTGDEKVQVLLDRRYEERRRRSDAQRTDRRRGDRRGSRGKDNGLTYHGFVIVRQLSGVQWRPPWWERGVAGAPVALEQPAAPVDPKAIASRNVVTAWLTEGQRFLHAVPTLLREHDQLKARAEAAERKCERCEGEIKSLRDENEHFRRERRQTAENLKALTKQLLESAGGSVRS
jgi:hypothetical protein